MAKRELRTIGDPILRLEARHLSKAEICSTRAESLIADLVDSMHAEDGIGIAAPQIGEPVAVAIVEIDVEAERYPGMVPFGLTAMFNPKITVLDAAEQEFWEGCLSVPNLRGLVPRPRKVRVDYLDLGAKRRSLEAEDFLATVVQHEIDHLRGVLFTDRIRDPTKLATIENYRKFWVDDEEDESEDGP